MTREHDVVDVELARITAGYAREVESEMWQRYSESMADMLARVPPYVPPHVPWWRRAATYLLRLFWYRPLTAVHDRLCVILDCQHGDGFDW